MRYVLLLCFIGLSVAFGLSLLITATGDPIVINRLREIESRATQLHVSDLRVDALCVGDLCVSDLLDALAAPYRKHPRNEGATQHPVP
jgi:hypothetical protein